jgi:hypothetical protein
VACRPEEPIGDGLDPACSGLGRQVVANGEARRRVGVGDASHPPSRLIGYVTGRTRDLRTVRMLGLGTRRTVVSVPIVDRVRPPWLLDCLLALGSGVALVLGVSKIGPGEGARSVDALGRRGRSPRRGSAAAVTKPD